MNSDKSYSATGISRRKIILIGGAVAILPVLGVSLYSSSERMIVQVLNKYLPDIDFDPDSLERFAEDHRMLIESLPRRMAAFVSVHLSDGVLPEEAREKLERMERRVVSDFLLGSDFFRLPDPESRPIKYIGRPAACGNPFAIFT